MSLVRFPLRPVTLAAALALQALSVSAQTAPDTADDAGRLPTVTVRAASADASAEGLTAPYAGGQVARGSRVGVLGNQDMMDTPFSVTSYTRKLIQDQQARSIGDVLLNDSSVRTARGFGNFQQSYFIRGFNVYSDDVAYNGLYGLVPRQYMATEFVERVEVFRGASAFLSGSGPAATGGSGIGGLINVVPKRAPNEDLNQINFGIQSGGGTHLGADIGRRFGADGSTGVRLNASHREGGTGIDDEKQKVDVFAVGADWRNRNVRLSADVGYQKNDLHEPRPSVTASLASGMVSPPDADNNYTQPWTYSNSEDAFATMRGEVDLSESVTAWGAYGLRRSREANSLIDTSLVNSQGSTSIYRADNVRKDDVDTGEIGIRGKFRTASVGHSVTASVSKLKSEERNAYAWSPMAGVPNSLDDPFPVDPLDRTGFRGGDLSNPLVVGHIRTSSFALADTLSFAQDTVLLTVGARRQTIEQYRYDYNTGEIDPTQSYDKSKTTPVAGLVFKLTSQISLYGNYIEGLVQGGKSPATGISNPNVTFAPYVSRQKEVGVKYDGGTLGASAAFFTTDKPAGYAQNGVFGQFGEQRNQGLEFSAFGQPIKGLRVIGGLTLLDAKLRKTEGNVDEGNRPIGVPERQLNISAEWDVPGVPRLSVNGLLLNTGSQYANNANSLKLPSWTRLDLGARYIVDMGQDRTLTLRGRVENVADKSYWASAGGYPGFGYMVQGQPRTISVSASVDF